MAKGVRLSTTMKRKESRERDDCGMGRIILLYLIEPSGHRGPYQWRGPQLRLRTWLSRKRVCLASMKA